MNARKLSYILSGVAVAVFAILFVLLYSGGSVSVDSNDRAVENASADRVASDDLWSGFGRGAEPPPGVVPAGKGPEDAPPVSPIDLARARDEMPNNLYWKMLAPTDDPELKEFRAREKARLNTEYGRVLSNTATPAQIRRYYDYKNRLSADYIRLLTFLLEEYGDELSERQEGMFKLGIELHAARIKQSPEDVRRALERHEAYQAKKAAYQASRSGGDS